MASPTPAKETISQSLVLLLQLRGSLKGMCTAITTKSITLIEFYSVGKETSELH